MPALCWRRGSGGTDRGGRRLVHFNSSRVDENADFGGNRITPSLYTWWSGPLKLPWEELFLKRSNFYFLVVSALQCWPEVSSTGGMPTSLFGLIPVVLMGMAIKIQEDRLRHQSDYRANTARCRRLVDGVFVDARWTDVQVGDLLKVCNREGIPADLLLVAASEPDPDTLRGACHVETMQLDGETNLKGKSAPAGLAAELGPTVETQLHSWAALSGSIDSEAPDGSPNTYNGTLHIEGRPAVPLTVVNMLLRGSTLRNSEYVLGIVVNTGHDTKVIQGLRAPSHKQSTLLSSINQMIVWIVLLLLVLCLIAGAAELALYHELDLVDHWYMNTQKEEDGVAATFLVNTVYFFLLLSAFVSVTLYVNILLSQKLIQYFMQWSLSMYDPESDTPMRVRNSQLVDELGVISHVFSDKTGTLTQNVMQFRKASIGGIAYGRGTSEIAVARMKRLGELPAGEDVEAGATEGAAAHSPPGGSVISRHVNFDDPALVEALGGSDEQGKRCREFFLHLALCHTVVTEVVYGERSLSASSPDETALVAGAERFGYRFIERHHDTVELQGPDGEPLQYEVLDVLEFSSARRRMSIVVRNSQTRAISLLSKGADTVMLPLLASGQEELVAQTEAHMHDHSNDGLRTLVIASKELSEEEYLSWSERYRRAASDLDEVEKKSREEPNAIDDQCDAMESRMRLLGSTALEDKLQEGVPACIADLVKAGIATWMLTGDKEETAINIAYACELLDSTTTVVVVGLKTHPNVEDITRALREATAAAEESMELSANAQRGRRALVIDGGALGLLFGAAPEAPACQLEFLRFTQTCATVVACRCAPAQKAKLVRLVRRNVRGVSALAIGDGANDVAMIQTAHVGVGISGKEGMLAVNAADFAIAQFRFLREMLLVQGRHNYRRIAVTVYYVFYKNIMFTLVIFWAQFFAAFSGTKWNLEAGNQLYNVLLTMFPILWFSVFDKDVSDETSLALPQLYHLGPGNHFYFNWRATLRWIRLMVLGTYASSSIAPAGTRTSVSSLSAPDVTTEHHHRAQSARAHAHYLSLRGTNATFSTA